MSVVYELDTWSRYLHYNADFTLDDCLFGAVKLTKNVNPNKYEYSSHSKGFNVRLQFSLLHGEWSLNVIIFGVDNSSSVHADHRKKYILVLGEGTTDGLDYATIIAEAKYFINCRTSGCRITPLASVSIVGFEQVNVSWIICHTNQINCFYIRGTLA